LHFHPELVGQVRDSKTQNASLKNETRHLKTKTDYSNEIRYTNEKIAHHARRCDYLLRWISLQLEELFNSLAKKHFLSKRDDEELYVALDDDKHHFTIILNTLIRMD
jgi:hypothetical protein